jgi:hypothetical protein
MRAKSEQGVLLKALGIELRAAHMAGPVGPIVEAAQGVVDGPQIGVHLIEQRGVRGDLSGVGHASSVATRRDGRTRYAGHGPTRHAGHGPTRHAGHGPTRHAGPDDQAHSRHRPPEHRRGPSHRY